jgi:type I restriction enzyme S subunit
MSEAPSRSDARRGMSEAIEGIEEENPSAYPPSIQAGIPALGETPKGWTRYRLGDLLDRVERPAKLVDSETYQLVTAKRNRGGIVAREVLRGDQIRTKTQFYVEAGDFLISNRQISHGACGIVPVSLDRAIVSNEYTAFHTADALDPAFLNALSHSIYFQQTCFHSSIGVHVEKLVFRLEDWIGWEFDIPSLQEQRRIVSVLNSWDQAIDQTERLIAAESDRRSVLLGYLFAGRLSRKPEGTRYQQVPLGEVSDCYSGGTPDRGDVGSFGGSIPWVKSGEVASSNIVATEETLSERGLATSSAKWVPAGSTLIAMYGANAGQVGRLGIDATTNQAILAVVSRNELVTPEYLYHSVINAIPSLMRKVQGSGQPNLSAGIVKEERIVVPAVHDQVKISQIATALETSIQLLKAAQTKLLSQRRGLMQKLLTGERQLGGRFDDLAPVGLTAVGGAA